MDVQMFPDNLDRLARWFGKRAAARAQFVAACVLITILLGTPWLLTIHDTLGCDGGDPLCFLCIVQAGAVLAAAPADICPQIADTVLWVCVASRVDVVQINYSIACYPPRGPPTPSIC